MSSNPPDLSSFTQDQTTGLLLPPLARRQVIPWNDLNVLNPSQQLSQVSPDLISALSVLSAQGPLSPMLLRTDALARLLVAANVMPVTTLADVVTPPQLTFTVADSTNFAIGMGLSLVRATSGAVGCGGMSIQKIPDMHTIVVYSICGGPAYSVGDFVIGAPVINIGNALFVQGDNILSFPGGAAALDGVMSFTVDPVGRNQLRTDATRALDSFLWSGNVTNAIASVQFSAPGAGKRLQLAFLRASTYDSGSAIHDDVEVWKNGLGTGTQLDGWHLLTNAPSAIDRLPAVSYSLVGDVNGTLGARVIRVGATTTHAVAMGVFILQT